MTGRAPDGPHKMELRPEVNDKGTARSALCIMTYHAVWCRGNAGHLTFYTSCELSVAVLRQRGADAATFCFAGRNLGRPDV